MTITHQPENWRVRFDEEFLDNGNWAVEWNEEEPHQITPSQVKSFIASEIEKSRQEALGEYEKHKKKLKGEAKISKK